MIVTLLDSLGLTPVAVDTYAYGTYLMNRTLRIRNARFTAASSPDGLSFPSPRQVFLVTGQFDLQFFYDNGAVGARSIKDVLTKNGYDIGRFRAILDFGCGSGRVMRHWKALQGPALYGTDFNADLVNWCQQHLPFATFTRNEPAARLAHADGSFDFIYAISVFTHLGESEQLFWVGELTRVLAPGGVLLITVHGESYVPDLQAAQQALFRSGRVVVIRERNAGSNVCAAYHPESHVRGTLARSLRVIDFIPLGAKDARQDVYLLEKPRPDPAEDR